MLFIEVYRAADGDLGLRATRDTRVSNLKETAGSRTASDWLRETLLTIETPQQSLGPLRHPTWQTEDSRALTTAAWSCRSPTHRRLSTARDPTMTSGENREVVVQEHGRDDTGLPIRSDRRDLTVTDNNPRQEGR